MNSDHRVELPEGAKKYRLPDVPLPDDLEYDGRDECNIPNDDEYGDMIVDERPDDEEEDMIDKYLGMELIMDVGTNNERGARVVNVDENNIFLWSLWINNKLYPCSVHYVGVKEFLWGNITVRAPIPFDSVLKSYYGNKWKESFHGTWQWDQHPFTIGSCTKNSSKIESVLETSKKNTG